MQSIILKPLYHRGQECIGIYFEKNGLIQSLIQKQAGARWSKSNSCWYVPCTGENYLHLKSALENKAELEIAELKKFLLEKRKNDVVAPAVYPGNKSANIATGKPAKTSSKISGSPVYPNTLSKENKEALQQFHRHLVLKAYSPSTIRTYKSEFIQFLNTIKDKPAISFTVSRLKDYFEYCYLKLHLSENTLHSRINALKFYYEQVLHREKFFWEIPRPKKPLLLPKLLNENELRKLFNSLSNKKHKAMLFTAYSSGLRVSEIVHLKIADIDSERMQIFIERAKGKKDRYVNLSPVLLDILRNYLLTYKPRPKIYLFESEQTLSAYPTRTIQQIFTNAKKKAGIRKDVGIHSLRHSFATHLLDKGTDIKYIKELLGHFNIKTTERYLHVSKERLVNIVSPFDDLWKKEGIEW
ncbi:MAG: tyrosine-type recombinase/integrase [Bacteroidota bacterium]|nr:tyrosine-type recombinase/integrase [Bacteroidota bacterium]